MCAGSKRTPKVRKQHENAMQPRPSSPAPHALLVVGPGCPHCASVLSSASELIKTGELGRLEIINADREPAIAATLGIRSIPWLRLGGFEFTGALTIKELRQWIGFEGSTEGDQRYFADRLRNGALPQVNALVQQSPQRAIALVDLMGDTNTGLDLRAGIAAVFESMEGTAALSTTIPALTELATARDNRLRADACHLLSTIDSDAARAALHYHRDDPDATVREIVAEAFDG